VARHLGRRCRRLRLHPSGVDRSLRQGAAVLVISEELEELLRSADGSPSSIRTAVAARAALGDNRGRRPVCRRAAPCRSRPDAHRRGGESNSAGRCRRRRRRRKSRRHGLRDRCGGDRCRTVLRPGVRPIASSADGVSRRLGRGGYRAARCRTINRRVRRRSSPWPRRATTLPGAGWWRCRHSS